MHQAATAAAGKFSEAVGATTIDTCLDCVAGKYSDIVNATSMDSCFDCVAGKYSDIVGATTIDTCVYCSAGKHMELETEGAAGPDPALPALLDSPALGEDTPSSSAPLLFRWGGGIVQTQKTGVVIVIAVIIMTAFMCYKRML